MPELTSYYKLKMKVRQYPPLHRPLKSIRRFWEVAVERKILEIWRVVSPAANPRFGPPKSSFSVYTAPRYEGRSPSRIVLHDQGKLDAAPESLLAKSRLSQHEFQPWPVFWSKHPNARLVSTSLALLEKEKQLCRESVYHDRAMVDDAAWNYVKLPKETLIPGNWTSIVSRWCPDDRVAPFSHWILDALPRLALLAEFPADTGILVPNKLAGYQKESLKLLGLLDRVRHTPEKHLVVENYYFSAPTAMISTYNPYGVNWLRSAFLPLADKSYRGPKRFIIQRKGKTRGILNEAEVNEFFMKLGWQIIDTETLTFAQEIQLFANAEAFAGVLGSGFTNAIWSSPDCKVLTFVADKWLDGWVEWICAVNKLEYHWDVFPSDHEMMVMIDLNRVKEMLAKAGL